MCLPRINQTSSSTSTGPISPVPASIAPVDIRGYLAVPIWGFSTLLPATPPKVSPTTFEDIINKWSFLIRYILEFMNLPFGKSGELFRPMTSGGIQVLACSDGSIRQW